MKVEYNGVMMDVANLLSCADVPEYDETGKDFLWVRRRIDFQAIYSPQKVVGTFTPNNVPGNTGYVTADTSTFDPRYPDKNRPNPLTPRQGPNFSSSPPQTQIALQQRLSQPRGKLRVLFDSNPNPAAVGDEAKQVWIESPGNDIDGKPFPCDLCNGPRPIGAPTVAAVSGNARTFMVNMTIEWCQNDCMPSLGSVPLISNQWTPTVSYDQETQMATRTFRGIAIFRADRLQKEKKFPDQYRFQLLPPVPLRCWRYIDELTQNPDGYSYSYTVRDVEQSIAYLDTPSGPNLQPLPADAKRRNVAKISCLVDRSYTQIGLTQAVEEVLDRLQRAAWTFENLDKLTDAANPLDSAGGALSAVLGAVGIDVSKETKDMVHSGFAMMNLGAAVTSGALSTANRLLPEYVEAVVCTVFMTGKGDKETGHKLAMATAFGQLTSPVGAPNAAVLLGDVARYLANATSTAATDAVKKILDNLPAQLPVANVYKLSYDAFGKWVQFSVVQTYSGLVDWTTGGVGGGLAGIYGPLSDEVSGANWPASALWNATAAGFAAASPFNMSSVLPPLPDEGKLLGTDQEGAPGVDMPVSRQKQGFSGTEVFRLGTDFTGMVAASLTGECQYPVPAANLPLDRAPVDPYEVFPLQQPVPPPPPAPPPPYTPPPPVTTTNG